MIYLLGGAGNPNFGDELMVRAWLETIRGLRPDDRIISDSNNGNVLSLLLGDRFPNVNFVSLFRSIGGNQQYDLWQSLERGFTFLARGGLAHYSNVKHFASRLPEIEIFHLHGGGYLNTLWPQSIFSLGLAASINRHIGRKVVATGLGMQPLPEVPSEYASLFADVISSFDVFELRDKESYDYVCRNVRDHHNVRLGLDDTFLLEYGLRQQRKEGRLLHLSFFHSKIGDLKKIIEKVGVRFLSQFSRAVFWECGQDEKAYAEIKKIIPGCERAAVEDLVRNPLPVAIGDFMITARFHPHLLAARLGCGGIFRLDGGYYDIKHGSVVALGSHFISQHDAIDLSLWSPQALRASPIVVNDPSRVEAKRALAQSIYGSRDQKA